MLTREQLIAHLVLHGWGYVGNTNWQGIFSATEGLVFHYINMPSPGVKLGECIRVPDFEIRGFNERPMWDAPYECLEKWVNYLKQPREEWRTKK